MKAFRAGLFGALGVALAIVLLVIVLAVIKGQPPSTTNSPGHWVQVGHFAGTGDVNTNPFTVGDRWRLRWTVSSIPQYAYLDEIEVQAAGAGQFLPVVRVEPNALAGTQNGYAAGTYYIKTGQEADTSWDLTIEDYR